MPEFRESCNRFCIENLCPILLSIVIAGSSAIGAGLGWYWVESRSVDRMTLQTDIGLRNATATLEQHIRIERENAVRTATALADLDRRMQAMQTDISVIKFRLDSRSVPAVASASN